MGINRAGRSEFVARALRHLSGLQKMQQVYYVVPDAGWANDWDGHYITSQVAAQFGVTCHLTDKVDFVRGSVIHYGSLWSFVQNLERTENSINRVVVTVFHGDCTDKFPELEAAINKVLAHQERINRLVVSCSLMEERFRTWGFAGEKITRIPLGVDLDIFERVDRAKRLEFRNKYGIPADALCIGSFQKDGNGWGEGLTPKLIKGPDVLVRVVERLRKDFDRLHVLLTGPARGYVKQALDESGVSYTHVYQDNYHDIGECYACLDLYLVTSREEGGPKAVLEAMACGIPLVSTRVGMAPDVVTHGVNGYLTDIDDEAGIFNRASELLASAAKGDAIADQGVKSAQQFDWTLIAQRYYAEVYAPLLKDLGA